MSKLPLPPAALAAIEQGNLIAAIQHVQKEHGLGLMAAKTFVEQYLVAHPEVSSRMHSAGTCAACGMPMDQCACE